MREEGSAGEGKDDPRALKKVGVAVGRSPDDSLELILRGGFGKGTAAAAAAAASEGCEWSEWTVK